MLVQGVVAAECACLPLVSFLAEASPAEFFVPYVWSHIVSLQAIPWTLPAITAFVPLLPKEGGGEEAAPLSALTSPFDVPLTNRDARPDDKNASNV